MPYSFFVDDHEILGTLEEVTNLEKEKNFEKITEIVYQPQAIKVSLQCVIINTKHNMNAS